MATSTTTTRKKAAAPKRGAAAKVAKVATAEKKAATKTIKALGLNLKIPAEQPGVLAFHYGDQEAGQVLAPIQAILRDTIGDEAYAGLIAEVRDRKLSMDETSDALVSLYEQILAAYGISEGA